MRFTGTNRNLEICVGQGNRRRTGALEGKQKCARNRNGKTHGPQ
jgi:hypothetical protein